MAAPPPLWSHEFLAQEVREQPEYEAIERDSSAFDAFVAAARTALASMQAVHEPDERTTIDRVIKPLLTALGWPATLEELSLTSHDAVDVAIFSESAEAEHLLTRPERDQVLGATGIVECKRWGRGFDAAGSGAPAQNRRGESAAQQVQRYLLTAGTDSNESVRWAILTNGARWRLYSYRARPRERTWQIDLNALLVSADIFESVLSEQKLHELRVAWLLLRRDSWVPAEGERETLLDGLLALGRRNDAQLANDLSDLIFTQVYPEIVTLFWNKQPTATAEAVARAALTFLYRLLFIYYAEDRGMLDTEDPRYRPHSLRYGVRDPVHEQHDKAAFSTLSTNFWQKLKMLRAIIDQGDASIGQPAYNGGLFASSHAILDEIELSDAELAPIIHQLSHTSAGTYLSYRNLEVQQLGSVYERLLERIPRRDDDNHVEVTISPYARKDSGSYYTPQELVDLIVEQTLTPLVEERIEEFRAEPIEANDPAAAILKLTILDPAMGSGHFLITAIDWLTVQLAALVNREWDEAPGYVSPLRARLWELQEQQPALADHTLARAHGAQALHLRRRQESDGRRACQGRALAAHLHRRAAAALPRSPHHRRRLAARHSRGGFAALSLRLGPLPARRLVRAQLRRGCRGRPRVRRSARPDDLADRRVAHPPRRRPSAQRPSQNAAQSGRGPALAVSGDEEARAGRVSRAPAGTPQRPFRPGDHRALQR